MELVFPKVSVIIAAYNAEKYLSQGIDGIINQTFRNFEILLVNDGSTDATPGICDEYAQKDSRIRVFHERHQGVAHARQKGIENAKGEYTIHIDADDIVDPDMLNDMLKTAEETNADLLICDYKEKNNKGTYLREQKPTDLTPKAIVNDLVCGHLYGALWNKLIKTSCYIENNIKFRKDLHMREDMFFLLDVLTHIETISYLPKAYYTYDRSGNINSLTNTYLTENRHYYDQEILWCKTALDSPLINDRNKERLLAKLLNYAYITLSGHHYSEQEWKKAFHPFIEEFRHMKRTYKRTIVMGALSDHYSIASMLRRTIAIIKGNK